MTNVLKAFANALKQSVRADDFVGRWGGEEFVVIANHVNKKELEQFVQKLQKIIAKIVVGDVANITASFGLTLYRDGDNDEIMFKRVDNALYEAKQTGRDRYVFKRS